MSTHPTHEKLAEFAWDALEGAEAEAVEAHVVGPVRRSPEGEGGCGDCARRVEKVRAEARRIATALETPVPAGLAARILDAAGPATIDRSESKEGGHLGTWVGLAAAALFAVTSAWAWRGMQDANRRIEKLEKELAARPSAGPVVATQPDDMDAILKQMARLEMEGEAGIVIASASGLSAEESEWARGTILAATEATAETVAKLARREIDWEALMSLDTFASLNPDLRAKLEPSDVGDIVAALDRLSRADALAVARALVGDLVVNAGLEQAQANALESLIVDKTAWRRDFHFLPDVVQRELAARIVGAEGKLRPESAALLNDSQKSRVLSFLASAETERKRYWDSLIKNANKH